MHADIDGRIDALFSQFDRPGTPGCAVGVIKDGALIYAKGHGYANLEHDVQITPRTVFHCASMSKQFTAMSIALLEEQGLVNAGDDIRLYLPELPNYGQEITVDHLVHMTNGLYDIYSLANFILGIREDDYFTREQAWEMVKACDWLMFRPGEKWSYGNTGYFLLAEIVERASGQHLSEFADRHIFQPLGMSSTLFRDDRAMLIKHRAESYSDYAHVHYNDARPSYCSRGQAYAINADLMFLPGAGGMWTTVEDLYQWDQNFYRNRLGKGSGELVQKVTAPGRLNDGSHVPYGYGLFLRSKSGFNYAFHGGSAYGWSSAIYRIPEQRFSVICLGNHTSLFDQIEVYPESRGLLDQVAELMVSGYRVGPEPEPTIGSSAVSDLPAWCAELAGEYQNPKDSWLWQITLDDGRLRVRENYSTSFELEAEQDETCHDRSGSLLVRAVRDCGRVTGLRVQRCGQTSFYHRFLTGLDEQALGEYAGDYRCQRLDAGFSVGVQDGALRLLNHNRHNTGIDLSYRPTIRDSFLASAPPYCLWYCITFQRDCTGQVVSFAYRDDEGSKRENLVFTRMR